jgi:hypothetical protein
MCRCSCGGFPVEPQPVYSGVASRDVDLLST